jgi:predicted RND superfamily exporter protein
MWAFIAKLILRNRIAILVVLAAVTTLMVFQAKNHVKLQYEFAKLLPDYDQTLIDHNNFKEDFGEDGNAIVIAVEKEGIYELENFNAWYDMGLQMKEITGVDSIFSVAHLYNVIKIDSIKWDIRNGDTLGSEPVKKFVMERVVKKRPERQEEVDSIRLVIESLPFYRDLIYIDSTNINLMMVFVNAERFNSENRGDIVDSIKLAGDSYHKIFPKIHYSGLPFIRSVVMGKVKSELRMFVILAAIVTALLIFFFFRSFKVVLVTMLVVAVGVGWSFGTMGLFRYEISILMGLIPPLIIVIGVPNCIYLMNKYQQEFKTHGNQVKALSRVIQKIGNATFMTNATTAMGFATFIFTPSEIMREFGIIASISIMGVFLLSIFLIPIVFSYLPPPKEKHTRHLDRKWLDWVVERLVSAVTNHRTAVYITTVIVVIGGFYGISKMQVSGNIVDDLPSGDPVLVDLKFFEKNFNGVMPFEVVIDTKRKGQLKKKKTLQKIEDVQELLSQRSIFSRSLSIVDAIKFLNQSFRGGSEEEYKIMNNSTRQIIAKYFPKDSIRQDEMFGTFVDTSETKTRIAVQIADIGTNQMDSLIKKISPQIDLVVNPDRGAIDSLVVAITKKGISVEERDSLVTVLYDEYSSVEASMERALVEKGLVADSTFDYFMDTIHSFTSQADFPKILKKAVDDQYYDVVLTGTSVVFTKGTTYLVKNLFISLMIAICIIAIVMAILFNSFRMVLVSLIPNLIPLVFTAAVMGYFGITIKPSTILVFSIAFGISVDDTIHFLAKYRQELKMQSWDIKGSVLNALRETGVSMIYTSIVLFFGFSMFIASNFGGTVSLGILVSFTLLVAMLANLVLLPALLLSLEKALTTKAFKEPLLEIVDEEEDIELDDLEIRKNDSTTSPEMQVDL